MKTCKFNPKVKCDYYLKPCVECEIFRQVGQRTLMEYVPKPFINECGTKSETEHGYPADIVLPISTSGLCRECGREASTGSQLFFICPVDGSWRSINDKCKFVESFEKAYRRKPTAKELRTYVQYIMEIRR